MAADPSREWQRRPHPRAPVADDLQPVLRRLQRGAMLSCHNQPDRDAELALITCSSPTPYQLLSTPARTRNAAGLVRLVVSASVCAPTALPADALSIVPTCRGARARVAIEQFGHMGMQTF